MSAMPTSHGGSMTSARPRRWVRGLASASRFVPRRGSACPPLDARFRDQCLNEPVFRGCQWHDGSLKHGGAITISAAPYRTRRSGPERVCSTRGRVTRHLLAVEIAPASGAAQVGALSVARNC
jgi:hypothetical protein